MSRKRILFGIAVLSVSLLTTTLETQAKDQLPAQRSQRTRSSNNLVPHKRLAPTSTQTASRAYAVSLSKRELEKLVKSAVKKCECACPAQETEFSMSCFKSCLARYVGWPTVLSCGVACTGNLIGCAVCVGVQEWVVLGCLQYCAWRNVFSFAESPVDGGVASNRGRQSPKGKAKLPVRSPIRALSN